MSGSRVIDSLVSEGCVVAGGALVKHSVLSPGVKILAGATVRESILLDGTVIGPGAVVDRAIIDQYVTIGEGARLGGGNSDPQAAITLIGREICLPPRTALEAGSMVDNDQAIPDYRIAIDPPERVRAQVTV
jgi:glucose-1-phosphate adenylyltransferase